MKRILLPAALLFSLGAMAQRVGIGTTTPNAKLEIVGEATSSTTNALIIKNSIGDTLLRMRNNGLVNIGYNGPSSGRTLNIGRSGINLFSDDDHFGGALHPTDTSLILWSQSEDNNYIILQPSWGKVGIGTYSPKAKLDARGDFKLGFSGTVLTHIIKLTIIRNLPSIAAGASNIQTMTFTDAELGGTVHVSPETSLPDGLIIAYARVSAADQVEIKFTNVSAAAINLGTIDFYITVIN